MPHPPSPANRHAGPRTLGRVGAGMLWLGIAASLGLTLVTTVAWGFSATALRARRREGAPDAELADLVARTDLLADASLWVALGAVPLGLLLVIAGLAVRGRANRGVNRGVNRGR